MDYYSRINLIFNFYIYNSCYNVHQILGPLRPEHLVRMFIVIGEHLFDIVLHVALGWVNMFIDGLPISHQVLKASVNKTITHVGLVPGSVLSGRRW